MFDLVNAEINPARMDTWEVSFLFTPVRQVSGQIAYFQNYASDLIVVVAAPGTPSGYSPQNAGSKEVGGVETLIRYEMGQLEGDLWHSYEYPLEDQRLTGTAENKLGLGGRYGFGEHHSLSVRAKYTDRAEGRAIDAQGAEIGISAPEYWTLDAHALAGEFEFGGVKWDLSFSVFNVFDRENFYVNTIGSNPSRFLAERREFFGKVAVRF